MRKAKGAEVRLALCSYCHKSAHVSLRGSISFPQLINKPSPCVQPELGYKYRFYQLYELWYLSGSGLRDLVQWNLTYG